MRPGPILEDQRQLGLFIHILSVPGAEDDNALPCVVNRIQHPVLTLVQPVPFASGYLRVAVALKLLAIVGTRILTQLKNSPNNLAEWLRIQRLEIIDDSRI